jgi:hypothetical protein
VRGTAVDPQRFADRVISQEMKDVCLDGTVWFAILRLHPAKNTVKETWLAPLPVLATSVTRCRHNVLAPQVRARPE